MSTSPYRITLKFGLRVDAPDYSDDSSEDEFSQCERLLTNVLGVAFESDADNDRGGVYLKYAPWPLPPTGVAYARICANDPASPDWGLEHRPELPMVAHIDLTTPDLLDGGRLTSMILRSSERIVLMSYVIVVAGMHTGIEFWRAHAAIFMTDEAGARRWTLDRPTLGDDIRRSEEAVAPVLTGHVTFAVRAADWTAATAIAARAFPVAFTPGVEWALGGDYLEYGATDNSVLLRRNDIDGSLWQFDDRKDVAYLLQVTMRTQSVLDLGRLVAELEAHGDLEVIATRVVGDLLHDRVPRMLIGTGAQVISVLSSKQSTP